MWLTKNQIAMPAKIQLTHIIDDVIKAENGYNHNFNFQGEHIIRRYQQQLYLTEEIHLICRELVLICH